MRKIGITALKLVLSAVLMYFVFTKIDISEIKRVLGQSQWYYLLVALLLFIFSKLVAAHRLLGFFHVLKVPIAKWDNLRLYALGMCYNLFLPGGIGGDAYKGYRLKKAYGTKSKKLFGVLLLDRLSGLLLLFVYACLLALNPKLPITISYKIIIVLAMGLSPIVYWIMVKKWFAYSLPVFWKSLLLSALVQFSQLLCVSFIVLALGMETGILAYLLIFLLSSIAAVLPLTIGGIGSREVTFLYGSGFLGLDETLSISLSICFFLMTALVSLLGFWYHFKPIHLASTLDGKPTGT